MASKTISLEESAYALLAREKRPGESFSMVVHRLLRRDDPMRRMIGLLSEETGREMAQFLEARREAEREATVERYKRLGLM